MRVYLLLVVNVFFLFSCKKYKPAEPTFFIKANPVSVSTNTLSQGSGSHKITDLFLYVNGKFQGAYPTGHLMPVITKNEKTTINIFAGIKNNGISDTRISWTFYEYITLDTLVESGKTIERPLTFKYNPNLTFAWLENFDSGNGYTIQKSAQYSDVDFSIAPASESFEGKSLLLELPDGKLQGELVSNISYPMPTGSPNVYLEINYKCTAPFTVGIYSESDKKSALVVTPQADWNKIYIQLAGVINTSPVTTKDKVFFRMINNSDYPNPKLYLDNIKLIYF